jgi:hypothetical protein
MNNNRQQRFREAAQTHRLNIQRSLEHRLEIARSKGDETLIHQLQAESNYYN